MRTKFIIVFSVALVLLGVYIFRETEEVEIVPPMRASGKVLLNDKAEDLFGICLVNQYSWLYLPSLGGWKQRLCDEDTNEETKRFFAVLLDNILTISRARIAAKRTEHYDLYTAYIRN